VETTPGPAIRTFFRAQRWTASSPGRVATAFSAALRRPAGPERSPHRPGVEECEFTRVRRRSWARLIAKTWFEDPAVCPSCGKEMKVLAAISCVLPVRLCYEPCGWGVAPAPRLTGRAGSSRTRSSGHPATTTARWSSPGLPGAGRRLASALRLVADGEENSRVW